MPRKYVRPARRRAYRKRKMMRKRGLPSVYKFKRLTQICRIYHQAGDAANIWQIQDPTSILSPQSASGVAWSASTIPGTVFNTFGTAHQIADLETPSDFTNLFDQYKITGIKCKFMWFQTDSAVGTGAISPHLLYGTDYDDNAPPSINALRQKQNLKTKILANGKTHSIFFRPRALQDLADGAGTSLAGSVRPGWINSQNTTVNHLGMKFALDQLYATTTSNAGLTMEFTYYLSCKAPQ